MTKYLNRILFFTFAFLGLFVLLFCQEKIPEGPERGDVLSIKLSTLDNRTIYPQETNYQLRYKIPPSGITMAEWDSISNHTVLFDIWIYNQFDEAFEGTRWIDIKLNIWPEDPDLEWMRTLTFSDTVHHYHFVLTPGDSTNIYTAGQLLWTQHDDAGVCIHPTQQYIPELYSRHVGIIRTPTERIPWVFCDTTYLAPTDTIVFFENPIRVFAQAEVQFIEEYPTFLSNLLELDIVYLPPPGRRLTCREGPPASGGE